jgi:prepilin peptidase CpaA
LLIPTFITSEQFVTLFGSFTSYATLVAAAAVLFYAALTDLRRFTISNDVIVVLILLFVLHTSASGRWSELPWNLGFATFIFAFLAWFYALGWMGGGDVKILTVALLWTGLHCALVFAILLLVFSSLHTVAVKLGRVDAQIDGNDGRTRIAFAPAVAAALIGVFALGCLQVGG